MFDLTLLAQLHHGTFDAPGFWFRLLTGKMQTAGMTVVNGQNTVTNPISGTQQFFRLSQ